jgi:hypothetical protein
MGDLDGYSMLPASDSLLNPSRGVLTKAFAGFYKGFRPSSRATTEAARRLGVLNAASSTAL